MSDRLPVPMRLQSGGLIDRSRPLTFHFDGRPLCGYAGDTLASALIANGVGLVGRSFKYHRPRGILCAGSDEPNALVELRSGSRREPNTRATVVELFDGLSANSQNRWPTLRFDLMSANRLFGPMLAAGFYYKTFKWPASFWERLYEPLIRRAAGLGRAAVAADPDRYEKSYAFCDLLVVGSGPAGLMAALTAGRAGARVLLVEEDFQLGGRLLSERRRINGEAASAWVGAVASELSAMPLVRLMTRTTVIGSYDDGVFAAVERVNDHALQPAEFEPRQRLWRIVTRRSVVAAGAMERPLLFGNNDLPGVMLAGAVRTYVNRYAAMAGRQAVVFADNEDAWSTAADLAAAGASVVTIVDPRKAPSDASTVETDIQRLAPVVRGVVRRALGGRRVEAAEIVTADGAVRRVDCDLIAMSGGWTPTLHLTSHQGVRPRWSEALATFIPGALPTAMGAAGAANGEFSTVAALAAGVREGLTAVEALGLHGSAPTLPEVGIESTNHEALWQVPDCRAKIFVDFQNDVLVSDVDIACHEGYRAVEQLKRYTTLGMGTDQGKTANLNGLALLAARLKQPIEQTGITTFRPPYSPVAIGALAGNHAGRHFRPTRLPPSHAWAQEQGAVFIESGAWLRAQYFPRPGEADWLSAVIREVNAVRTGVGICDVSTLGKIDVQGPDALLFLERVYANGLRTLPVGRARYGLMLREDGFLMDDGTVSRLGDCHYLITTTTANAGSVFQHMRYCHQVLWPALDVQFVSVSEQWAQFSIAGPQARELLNRIVRPGEDLSNNAFPYLAVRELTLDNGVAARLFRISFSGELAYELAVPARHGAETIRRLCDGGGAIVATPYGLETLGVMRIEKGHIAGNELNGQTTAYDLGLGRMVSAKKDYVGAVLARRAALADPARHRLVGVMPCDPEQRLIAGAHLVAKDAPATSAHDEGFLSSVCYSPTVKRWIGLALLSRGPERHGERMRAVELLSGHAVDVDVVAPVFVDASGTRLHG